MQIRRAERKKAKLRLGISGASGSGKTWSALEIATGMGGKIGMIDTESGRGELYGDDFEYDIIRLTAPYSPDRYIEAIRTFEDAGYDTLIIDSLSHAWNAEGGVLSLVDKAGGNSFTNGWRTVTPKQNALIDSIINCKLHVICTLRVKTEYIVERNNQGKAEPKKVGLSPVQRDGLEYEFTLFMDMSQEHIAHVTKDNTKLFDQEYIKPCKKMGNDIMGWLNTGLDTSPEYFKENILPEIINEIESTHTKDELKSVYGKHYHKYIKQYGNEFIPAIDAKDKKKHEFDSSVDDDKNEKELIQAMGG
jgi:hypothetical protein